jgi:hypothetical protein
LWCQLTLPVYHGTCPQGPALKTRTSRTWGGGLWWTYIWLLLYWWIVLC